MINGESVRVSPDFRELARTIQSERKRLRIDKFKFSTVKVTQLICQHLSSPENLAKLIGMELKY